MTGWDTNLNLLKDELADLYEDEEDIHTFVREVGFREGDIKFGNKATSTWSNILHEAQKVGLARVLSIIQKAQEAYKTRIMLQVTECYIIDKLRNGDAGAEINISSENASVAKVLEDHVRVRATIRFLRCWSAVIADSNRTTPEHHILPGQCKQIQSLLTELHNRCQQEYTHFHKETPLSFVWGPKSSKLRQALEVINSQLEDLIKRLQALLFNAGNGPNTSFEAGQDIQKKIVALVQLFDDFDNLMYSSEHQVLYEATQNIAVNTATWDSNLNALRDELAYFFSGEDECYVFAKEVGLDLTNIIFTRQAINNWYAILDEAQKAEVVLLIIEKAREQYPNSVDLQVAECYIQSQVQQPAVADASNSTTTLFENLIQIQRVTRFLNCWQTVVTQLNKNMPGSPLSFEQCDSIKPFLQGLKPTITRTKQLLAGDHYVLVLEPDQQAIGYKLSMIDEKLDFVMCHMQYLLDCNDKKTILAMDLRRKIQYAIAEIIQHLEAVNSLTSTRQKRL